MDALTGAAIAKLAFDEFIKSAAGEAAKKAVGGTIEQLRSVIKARFTAKHDKAETAIATIESTAEAITTEQKTAALNKLAVYLDDEMDDAPFAQNLRQLAQQIVNIGKQEQSNVTFNIDAQDNSRVNAIGELNADTVNFGDR